MSNSVEEMGRSRQNLASIYTSGFHPFFFSMFFVLRGFFEVQLYANKIEAVTLLLMALVAPFAALKLFELFLRNKIKAAILASMSLFILLHFGEIRNELQQHGFFELARYRYMALLAAGILGITATFLYRSKRSLANVNACFNLISLIYVLIEVFHIFAYTARESVVLASEMAVKTKARVNIPGRRDIYYIIFDSYTSNQSLKEFWNFDNAEITEYLRKKEFFIAENSNSNYNVTPYSLASSLNMSYLQVNGDSDLNLTMRVLPLRELINQSFVARKLRAEGYEVINLSPFSLFNQPEFYDCRDLPDFSYVLSKHLFRKTFAGAFDSDFFVRTEPDTVFEIHKAFKTRIASSTQQSRFVYAHFMLPRSPFVFTKEGEVKPFSQWRTTNQDVKSAGYLDQVLFTNKIIFDLVEQAHKGRNSRQLPIIIIQGDHGSWVWDGEEGKRETTTIFNAFLLPDNGGRLLYSQITPVNSFRIIFNHYFSGGYPMLEDQVFEVDANYIPRASRRAELSAKR